MIALDSSVAVAAFASWHESHQAAQEALRDGGRLPAHAASESYSVLTRLPAPHRAPPELVSRFLSERFSAPLLELPEEAHRRLIADAASHQITGGAVYDGLVGLTAQHAGLPLLTLDRRASRVYRALGVTFELLSP